MDTILLIDDDVVLLKKFKKILGDEGYNVLTAVDYGEMRENVKEHYKTIDCIILDILLPDVDGIEILTELKNNHRTKNLPIIMISARDTEHLVVESFKEGADDYVSKPIRNNEFIMRIKFAIERAEKLKNVPVKFLRSGKLEVDLLNRTAFYDNEMIKLTNKEYHLLILFMQSPQKIFDRKELMEALWKKNANFESRTVDLHVSTLRKKLNNNDLYMFLETIRGMGYRFKGTVEIEK